RQFTRLHIHLDAELDFGSQRYYRHSVGNISLGGLYVNGNFAQRSGDICTVTLNHSELDEALEIHATCSVIRSNERGVSLEFISMKLDDFCHLQTLLLYQADDPVILGTEFVNNINLELEDDLILCNSFSFQDNKEAEA
ncbi:MAG: PilZ domain-containing protein, partial [Candidatus Electrothrix sp. ATG1]|nr:PilZ domain-containing protein [Candidatus Electrothrix sp. ATG1]